MRKVLILLLSLVAGLLVMSCGAENKEYQSGGYEQNLKDALGDIIVSTEVKNNVFYIEVKAADDGSDYKQQVIDKINADIKDICYENNNMRSERWIFNISAGSGDRLPRSLEITNRDCQNIKDD